MIDSYIKMWKNGYDFKGRSRRRDYWEAILLHIIIASILIPIALVTHTYQFIFSLLDFIFSLLNLIAYLYCLLPCVPILSLNVRRLHDTGKSGWWLLLLLMPTIGWVILLLWMCEKSKPKNQWGDNPLDEI